MVLIPSQAMGFGRILLVLVFLEKSWEQEQRCVISVPAFFRVGVSENITVQAHGHTDAFDATISVKSYPDENLHYSSDSVYLSPENKFQNSTVLTIPANQLSEGQNLFSHVYVEVVSKNFSKSEKVPVIYGSDSLFVHTDKSAYTPQQLVKVGVYSVDEDLKPVTRETILTLIDPEGSEVDTLPGSNDTGIVSFPDFKIPSNPKYGRWTINAKYREDASRNGTAHFDIKEHDKAYKVTVIPISNVQRQVQNPEQSQGLIFWTTDDLIQKITEQASSYKHPVIKKCCYDGARHDAYESCEQRASRVKIGPNCVRAFTECCSMATQIRASDNFKHITVGRQHLSSRSSVEDISIAEFINPSGQ